ncbi:helix-turn-helix transcriptional regulator [Ferrovibrio sp.]|jgi:transcriptional regulator with XRE-family HTH domain|uniref:helix-turn-helix domain-containing protein n=1 Tax=Ferrovibrio sp. TaxID=1917215 RepID=UPI00262F792F|nr:helix-turn-helix transcriptional regulator [Ferrovibrio sp.]
MDAQKLVAHNLKRMRLLKRVSQEDLAEDAGIARSYVWRLEKGEVNPTLDTMDRLAQALGGHVRDLLAQPQVKEKPLKALPKGPKGPR